MANPKGAGRDTESPTTTQRRSNGRGGHERVLTGRDAAVSIGLGLRNRPQLRRLGK